MKFEVIDQNLQQWTGIPIPLEPNQGVTMPKTPTGQIVLAYKNQALDADLGQLAVTSGGSPPKILDVEALLNAPNLEIQNYEGNNLNVTNISNTATIWIAAYGPGFNTSSQLPIGTPVAVAPYACTATRSQPNFQRLTVSAPGQYSVAVVYIGSTPSVYAINSPDASTVPAGYTKVLAANTLPLTDNWLGKSLWVGNLSPDTNDGFSVTLINL
jgi:hypothetical protein